MKSVIESLAVRQLAAYNAADLDAFCDCYHPHVQMFEGEELTGQGLEEFRSRYADKFARGNFGATVPERLSLGGHCVDLEHWWSVDADGERSEGTLLVRYLERDGKIAMVQFLD